ncbi:MAG: hypothetical protein ACRERR_10900 [Moraxellaceae bacterium]
MKSHWIDRLAVLVFMAFFLAYLFLLKYVSQAATQNTFDLIQGSHVFDIDDIYRLFLAKTPFASTDAWFWNYMLPVSLIFDGFLSWISKESIYFMRASHMVCVLSSVYRAGRHLEIPAAWMLASCTVLLAMPLYALLSMSFYGESLLAALMGVVIYAAITEKEKLLVIFSSLLPLVRPEGIFFLLAMAVERSRQRRFLSAALMLIPGFIYFCGVMYFFDFSINDYFGWRNALSSQYSLIPVSERVMGFGLMPYYTINPLWWIFGLAAAPLSSLRVLRPLFLATVVLMIYWALHCVVLMDARGEARYYFAVFPLLAISLAAGMSTFCSMVPVAMTNYAKMASGLLVAFILVENSAQIDQVRAKLFFDRRWPLAGEAGAVPELYIEAPDVRQWRETTARFLEAYSQFDGSIRRIIIHAYPVFSDLNASSLPERVRVEYSPMTPMVSRKYFYNYFYSMFPALPQYSFYKFSPADGVMPNDGGDYALYVGPLYNGVRDPIFANPVFQVYKVRYSASLHPEQGTSFLMREK